MPTLHNMELNDLPASVETPSNPRSSRFSTFVRRQRDSFRIAPGMRAAEVPVPLERCLKSHHTQLIALGGAIGTGLFIGTGRGLSAAGPLPLLAAFCCVGLTVLPTIFALGEMSTLMPVPGAFVEHSRLLLGDSWAGAVGWNYAMQWLLVLPLELVASSITLQYWGQPPKYHAAWVTLFLVAISVINLFGVKGFANVEATLSLIKTTAIVGFIVLGILIDSGLGFGGNAIGVQHWYNPGAGRNGWSGFCNVLIIAAFAYSGTELVGLTAAESLYPRRDIPKAVKKVFWRIGIFYIASIFVIGLIVPYTEKELPNANSSSFITTASPFVIALKRAEIKVLPSIMNAVILITVLSVANSSVYGSTRVLNALADKGLAPKIFAVVDKSGRPMACFGLALCFGFLAYLSELTQENAVFVWLLATCGLSSTISWFSICATHIRFRKALQYQNVDEQIRRGIRLDELPFRSPWGVIGSYFGVLCCIMIIALQFYVAVFPIDFQEMSANQRAQSFFSSFMAFPIIILVWVAFRHFKGKTWRQVASIEFPQERYLGLDNSTNDESAREREVTSGQRSVEDDEERTMRDTNARQRASQKAATFWWLPQLVRNSTLLLTLLEFPWEKEDVEKDGEELLYPPCDRSYCLHEACSHLFCGFPECHHEGHLGLYAERILDFEIQQQQMQLYVHWEETTSKLDSWIPLRSHLADSDVYKEFLRTSPDFQRAMKDLRFVHDELRGNGRRTNSQDGHRNAAPDQQRPLHTADPLAVFSGSIPNVTHAARRNPERGGSTY